MKINVLVLNGKEFEEYIGLDGKKYMGRSTDKMLTLPHNTFRANLKQLRYDMTPFSRYKKEV